MTKGHASNEENLNFKMLVFIEVLSKSVDKFAMIR